MRSARAAALALAAVSACALAQAASAEDAAPGTRYLMAGDLEAVLTFTFRDGVEVHAFPVFRMGEDMVAGRGASFTVQGVVGEAPHLHEAVDQAYMHRLQATGGSGFEYGYRHFEVDVDFVRGGQTVKTLGYRDCGVADYAVKTLRDDQEGYVSAKTGFAVVDEIRFECGGLGGIGPGGPAAGRTHAEYAGLEYGFAGGVRTFVTFEFDEGTERIEFPYFETTSGFSEEAGGAAAEFLVEGIVEDYPLLHAAVDKSRRVSGMPAASNNDFDALVEFARGGEVLRALEYRDCIVATAEFTTHADKEDGFTGKGGFAMVGRTGVACAGLLPAGGGPGQSGGEGPEGGTHGGPEPHGFPSSGGVRAVATFTFGDGTSVVDFPYYAQRDVLGRSNPGFTLEGIVGDTPLLYGAIDENLGIQGQSGPGPALRPFQADIDIVADGRTVRTFGYADCRVTDYVVRSLRDGEDGYFKGFALANIIDFGCLGYRPYNPAHGAMSHVPKADNIQSGDLRQTHDWGDGFYVGS